MASGRRGPSGSRPCIECMSRGFESALTKNMRMRAPGTSILPIDAGQPGGTPPIKVAGPKVAGGGLAEGCQPWPGKMLSYHSCKCKKCLLVLIVSTIWIFLKLKFEPPIPIIQIRLLNVCISGRRGSRWHLRIIYSSTILALFQRPLSSLPAAPSKPLNYWLNGHIYILYILGSCVYAWICVICGCNPYFTCLLTLT